MSLKPKIGISSCLLGEQVRYDGGHKLNHYLKETLGPFVTWIPVCPEVECGLPVPREAMHLVEPVHAPRLMTIRSGVDHTRQMQTWIGKQLKELEKENLCGYIFKSKSPSSGMRDIKVYKTNGNITHQKTAGLFAGAFIDRFPDIPVEDEGRLQDAMLRENFIDRIFTAARWRETVLQNMHMRSLIEFHTRHKLLIMAHSPSGLKQLGQIVSETNQKNISRNTETYFRTMMAHIKRIATITKNINTLQHIMGYFKKNLTGDEKQELLEIIKQYRLKQIPLVVPVTLLNHYVRKYEQPYLRQQVYLHPHPAELMLRNHV